MNFFVVNDDFESIIKKSLKSVNDEFQTMKPISTGWTNIVYKVYGNNGKYYFRFPRDEFWMRTIVKDCQFAQYVHGKTDFDTVDLKLMNDGNGRFYSLHKEIPGKPLTDVMNELSDFEIDDISKDISKFMVQLHRLEKSNKVFNVDNISTDLQGFVDELLRTHLSKEDMEFWKKHNFRGMDDDCLVHGDFNASNVLVDDNNKFKAVIDFGFGGYGNKYQDISRIIGRCPAKFKNPIVMHYENISGDKIDMGILDENIHIWANIDQGYINYMEKNLGK